MIAALVTGLEDFIDEDQPPGAAAICELVTASRDSEEIRAELAQLYRRWREHLGAALRQKEARGRREAEGRARGRSPRCCSRSPTASASR